MVAKTKTSKQGKSLSPPCVTRVKTSQKKAATKVRERPPEDEGGEILKLLPHQVEAFKWLFEGYLKKQAKYYAADPGLGKTIVAAWLAKKIRKPFVYICPPFLVANTHAEFEKWSPRTRLHVIPDSMLAKKKTFKEFLDVFEDDSYLVVDEAHRFKNEKAKRSNALLTRIVPRFKNRVVYLSGTPMPNSRPKELWPILKASAPDIFGDYFFDFAVKYCDAFRGPFGWNFDGFSNRAEFKARLTKSFMLRQKKALLNLPPKIEGLLTVGSGIPPVISALEKKILAHYSPQDLIQGRIAAKHGKSELHLMTYMRLLGEYKLKYVLPYIESILEETKENLLLFAVHTEVIAKLTYALAEYEPLVITGKTKMKDRQPLVKKFQESKKHRVFIGNINACGTGFTLTKATRVLFIEFSWVDGDNSQASDRAHRIGQNNSVFAQYVVLKDSFDRKRMEVLLRKRQLSI